MKKIYKCLIVLVLLSLTLAIPLSSTVTAFANEHSSDDVYLDFANEYSNIITYSDKTDPDIQPPNLNHTSYNTMVTYRWTVGYGADKVDLSRNLSYWTAEYDMEYFDLESPGVYGTGEKYLQANFYYAKSYNSVTNLYSEKLTSVEHTVIIDGVNHVRYGYDSLYAAVAGLPKASLSTAITVPTSFNQDNFVWYHNAKTAKTIKATIAYNNVVRNTEVTIPLLGYNSTYVIVNGVKFTLRTGPKKCSLIADQSGIPAYQIRFAFGIA